MTLHHSWDDLRFVLAAVQHGSLARAAKALQVDHTTVGRRIDAAEAALGVSLFIRTSGGLVPTADARRLMAGLRQVETAVAAVARAAAPQDRLEGRVRVTAPETFGAAWLAPRLAAFCVEHPALHIELVPAGAVLDLGRGEAEIAVRMWRSKSEDLVVRRVGQVVYGAYAAASFIARRGMPTKETLAETPLLSSSSSSEIEAAWLRRLSPAAVPSFTSDLSLALLPAARAGAGVAILPRYLGDADDELVHVPLPDPPSEPIWLTVHRDLRATPRVRALLDAIVDAAKRDAALLRGR